LQSRSIGGFGFVLRIIRAERKRFIAVAPVRTTGGVVVA